MKYTAFDLMKDSLFDLAVIMVWGAVIVFIIIGWVVGLLFRPIGRRVKQDDLADGLHSADSGNIG